MWLGTTRKDIKSCPKEVRRIFGRAIDAAALGDKSDDAKPLRGFGGASVVEVVANHFGDTFRAVYTVRFADAIYVLHVFQKKSHQGSKTPSREFERVRKMLKQLEASRERT